ncbi:MAG TPA: beta-ketoacyl-[acyl-carrier-protein] synthase family protein [Polyangiaceae bacterium]|nr:beta-ketoacyl-[acyl-carrier-protein] synthase family protein [Polyangiaceae bacterium]
MPERIDARRSREPIAITGMAAWTSYGRGLDALLHALATGRVTQHAPVGLDVDLDDPFLYARVARQIALPSELKTLWDRSPRPVTPEQWPTEVAVTCAGDALLDAGRPEHHYDRARIAICNGTSHGSNHGLISYLRQSLSREPDPNSIADASSIVARRIALRSGALGPNYTLNTACSSGINAIGQGMNLLRSGRADCVIAGAHDTFSELSFVGFTSLKALDPNGCRPFDVQREGLTLADGAAYLVLERIGSARARGRKPLALITGYGCVSEAYHATAPAPDGDGVLRGMLAALSEDGRAEELDLVFAHGTGTPANDAGELKAIQRLTAELDCGNPLDVVSLKSQLGHALGAAGSLQIVAAAACLRAELTPGNIGLQSPISHSSKLRLRSTPARAVNRLVICNALGFGGSVATACLRLESEAV